MINIFLPMRDKLVYFCAVKICALGFVELLESIFCFLLVVEAFSLEKEMLKEVVSVRGQVNMANEAKLCSPIRSPFEALVVRHSVRHCHGEELGRFVGQCLLQVV